MSFDHFVESLENVPPELERNFTLITDLDKRTEDIMKRIKQCIKEYKNTMKRSERLALRRETDELFEKLSSYSDDKIVLALQTYDLIDKNIKRLINLNNQSTSDEAQEGSTETPLIGFDMPLDPNEPLYCVCRSVSYGEMIACDNKECHIEWFHYGCVGLQSAVKGKWYCPECYGSFKKQKSRSKRRR